MNKSDQLQPSKKIELFSGHLMVTRIQLELVNLKEQDVKWENFNMKSKDRFDYFSDDFDFNSFCYIYFEIGKWFFNIISPERIKWIKEHYLIENVWVQQKNFIKEFFNIDISDSKISLIDLDVINFDNPSYINTIKDHSDLILDYSDETSKSFIGENGKIEYSISTHTDIDGEEDEEIYIERICLEDGHEFLNKFNYNHFINWDIASHLKYFVVQQRNVLVI